MARERITIDDPDDEILPASPRRRKIHALVGCLTLLILLAVLVWFVANNTQTFENRSLFGG